MRHGIYHYYDVGIMVPTQLTMNKEMHCVPTRLESIYDELGIVFLSQE
jgi:hypothetical protein